MSLHPYLLLGEAPNEATANRPDLWLLPDDSGIPHSANRLLKYTGYAFDVFLDTFERDNLLHDLPPKKKKGRAFSVAAARREVGRIFEVGNEFAGLVVLGRRAASAFSWIRRDEDACNDGLTPSSQIPFLEWNLVIDVAGGDMRGSTIPAAIVPHPSGMNQWWNKEHHRQQARFFFDRLLEFVMSKRGQTMGQENGHRWRKVAHLMAALYAHGVPRQDVQRMRIAQWKIVAKAAGINEPSMKTIVLLRSMFSDVAKTVPKEKA